MLDWRQYVRQNLKLSFLPANDEGTAIEEIAQQLQDAYRDALDRGVPPSEAVEQAKLHIPDWNTLALEVALQASDTGHQVVYWARKPARA
jgi:hypothetical protein